MITEDYVSFETAKILKERGFDGVCRAGYTSHGSLNVLEIKEYLTNQTCSDTYWNCTAPTLQLVCKWLREVYKIYIDIDIRIILEQWAGYNVTIYKTNTNNCLLGKFISLKGLKDNTSYEQACEAAIKYCLENLI